MPVHWWCMPGGGLKRHAAVVPRAPAGQPRLLHASVCTRSSPSHPPLCPSLHPPRRSEAILRIGQRLSLPLPLLAGLAQLVPLPLRDGVYEQVADNRWAGVLESCRCQASQGGFDCCHRYHTATACCSPLLHKLLPAGPAWGSLVLTCAIWPCRRYSFFGRSSSCRLSAEGFQDRFIEA